MRNLCLVGLFILLSVLAIFAQKERDKGVEFYNKGDYESSIKYLSLVESVNKKDGDFWYLLGMAYFKVSQFDLSRLALEKAVKLKPQNSEFRTNLAFANFKANRLKQAEKDANEAIKLDSKKADAFYIRGLVFLRKEKFDNAIADAEQSLALDKSKVSYYQLKTDAILYKFGQERDKGKELIGMLEPLRKSVEILEACAVNCISSSDLTNNKDKLEVVKTFYEYFLSQLSSGDESNITELSLLSKPSANYTDSARRSQIQGTITLAVFFSADGNTKKFLVLRPLSYGLTEQAVAAAQKIKFIPQKRGGKPISVVKLVQYAFKLY
ncbi:MAG: tetratricopeptide repeat protein [Pyrinomonadaceae bacterium]|nr:tetratricopeptide repeat protein [Pyrinomonadaceae bacterium]